MKLSVVAAMKQRASKNFKLKDVSFVDFDEIEAEPLLEPLNEEEDATAEVNVSANFKISYEGDPPDSYRVLNSMIQDWVEDHGDQLRKLMNSKLLHYLKEQYKDVDISDLKEDVDDYTYEDQVDYMIFVDTDNKEIDFTVELVLEVEDTEED